MSCRTFIALDSKPMTVAGVMGSTERIRWITLIYLSFVKAKAIGTNQGANSTKINQQLTSIIFHNVCRDVNPAWMNLTLDISTHSQFHWLSDSTSEARPLNMDSSLKHRCDNLPRGSHKWQGLIKCLHKHMLAPKSQQIQAYLLGKECPLRVSLSYSTIHD